MRERSKLMYIFSLPRLGNALLMGIVGFATFNLYTVGYQVPEFLAGSAISMGYIAIALSQFFFGWISDKWYVPRLGRRKPWVLFLTPIGVISFIAVMLPGLFLQSPSTDTLFIWLLVWDMLFEMAYAATTPYGAWMAETFTVDERPKTSQLQSIFNFIGYGIMTIFTMIVLTGFTTKLQTNPGAVPPEYVLAIILFHLFLNLNL